MEDNRVCNEELLVVRSEKICEKICSKMKYVLDNKELNRSTSREVDSK